MGIAEAFVEVGGADLNEPVVYDGDLGMQIVVLFRQTRHERR